MTGWMLRLLVVLTLVIPLAIGTAGVAQTSLEEWILTAPEGSLPPSQDDPVTTATPSPHSTLATVIPLQGSADRFGIYTSTTESWAVVGQMEAQTVTAFDLSTGNTLWTTSVGFSPTVVKLDPEQGLVYASGIQAPGVVILDVRSGALVKAYGLPAGVLDIALDLANGRLFATMPSVRSLGVIQREQEQARNLPLPGTPLAVVYDPQRKQVIVSLGGEDPLSLVVLNPDNGELLARWRSGNTPEAMVLDQPRQRLIVLNSGSDDLSILDLTSNGQQVQRIGLDWRPTRLALSADGQWAYVSARDSDRLQVVNLNTLQQEASYPVSSQPTGIEYVTTPQGSGLWVVAAGVPQLQWILLPDRGGSEVATTHPRLGAVAGRVLDVADQPVSSGRLILHGETDGNRDHPIALDGSYLLSQLKAGVYLLDVEVPGYPPTSLQIQVRSGFVSTQDVRLPPRQSGDTSSGVGLLPDAPVFSDELARQLQPALAEWLQNRQVILLNGPLGPDPTFKPLQSMVQKLTLLDGDERYTQDLERLRLVGNTLGLRYILLTHVQIEQDYNRQGDAILNTALRFLAPVVPVTIPNFTPNQLRSRGLVVVVDLEKHRPGEKAKYYEAYGRDDVGGDPLFEEAAAGLFRLEVRNMVPEFVQQWKTNDPFVG